jgi:hypothetical protein
MKVNLICGIDKTIDYEDRIKFLGWICKLPRWFRQDEKWSINSFPLSSGSVANHGGLAQLLFFLQLTYRMDYQGETRV